MSTNPIVLVIALGAAIVIVGGCSPRGQESEVPQVSEREARQQKTIETAKNFVLQMLKDPSSAQFRNIKTSTSYAIPGREVALVCGEYNAKNEMGGYVGFKSFSWQDNKPTQLTDLNLC